MGKKVLCRHVKGRFILARKTGHGVFEDCTTPYRHLQVLFPCLLTHGCVCIKNSRFNIRGYLSIFDQLLHFLAPGRQLVIIADIKLAGHVIQDVLDLIVLDKGLVGICRYHKASWNRKVQGIGKLSQMGKFTAGRLDGFFSDVLEAKDIIGFGNGDVGGEALANGFINHLIWNNQILVFFICKDIQIIDYPPDPFTHSVRG